MKFLRALIACFTGKCAGIEHDWAHSWSRWREGACGYECMYYRECRRCPAKQSSYYL